MSTRRIMPDRSRGSRMKKKVVTVDKSEAHEHKWQNGAVTTKEAVSYSPCSSADDHIWEWIIQHRYCECGATDQLVLGYKNMRRRGDDARIANGLRPLGTPLQRSETYNPPRRFRR